MRLMSATAMLRKIAVIFGILKPRVIALRVPCPRSSSFKHKTSLGSSCHNLDRCNTRNSASTHLHRPPDPRR